MADGVTEGFYKMKYKCANCGETFESEVRKGSPSKGASGSCPNCGMQTGKPGVGHHEAVFPDTPAGKQEILHG